MAYQPQHNDNVSVGDIVFVSRNRIGVVRYIGRRAGESGIWIGVDLKYGYADGCDGGSYFNTTGKRSGLFVRNVARKVHYRQLLDKAAMHTLGLSQAQMYFILEETLKRKEQIRSATNDFLLAELAGRVNDVKCLKELYDARSRDPDGLPALDECALTAVLQTMTERHAAADCCRLVDLKQLSINNEEWIPLLTAVVSMVRTEKQRRRDAAEFAHKRARRKSMEEQITELKADKDLREFQKLRDEQMRQFDRDRENWTDNKKALQRVIETKDQELQRLRREVEQLRADISTSKQGINRAAAEYIPTTRTQHRSRPSQIAEEFEEERKDSATKPQIPPHEQPMARDMGTGIDVAHHRREQHRLEQEARRVKECLTADLDSDVNICWEFNERDDTCRNSACKFRHRYYVNRNFGSGGGVYYDDIETRYVLTKGQCMRDPRLYDMSTANGKRPALTVEEIEKLAHIQDTLPAQSHSPKKTRRFSMGPGGL